MELTREKYIELRQQGMDKDTILNLAARGRIDEAVNKQTFKQKGLFRAAGDVLGMEEFGRGIGTTISNISGTQKKVQGSLDTGAEIQTRLFKKIQEKKARGEDTTRLMGALQQLGGDLSKTAGQLEDIGTGGLSNREVVGSALQTGLSVVGLRGGLPTSAGVAAKTGLGKIGAGAVSGAIGGGAFGGAEAITEGTGVIPGVAKGAAVGGVVGGAMGAIGKYIDDLSSRTPKKRLGAISDRLKTVRRSFDKNSRHITVGGKRRIISDPITTLTDNKIIPEVVDGKIAAGSARERIREIIAQFDDESIGLVDDAAAAGKSIKLDSLRKEALKAVQNNDRLKSQGVVGKVSNQINNTFDDFAASFGTNLDARQVNNIRIAQNKLFNPETLDSSRVIGDAARKFVYKAAPGAQEALRKEGQFIAADKFLDVLDGKAVQGGRLGKYFANLIGAMAGARTTEGFLGPVIGAAGGSKVAEVAQKQAIDPIAGKAARAVLSGIEKLPTDTAGNISKTAVLNLLGQLVNR